MHNVPFLFEFVSKRRLKLVDSDFTYLELKR